MTYRPSEVTVQVLPNPRIISLGTGIRIPALVGLGPTTLTVTDEAVAHGTGSVDYLLVYPSSGVSVTQVAKRAGLTSGALDYATGSLGSLYPTGATGYTPGTDGSITWNTAPAIGTVFYTSYTYPIPATNLDPMIFTDKDQLKAVYGEEGTTTGLLTIGGSIVLENNAPAVMCVQASGSVFSEANYNTAIDKLLKKDSIEDLIILFPPSATRTNQENVIAYAYQHVQFANQINIKKERGLGTGSPSADYASGGFDTIGDATTAASYVGRATVLKNENVFYVAPSTVTRTLANGSTLQLDGNFAAAAVTGVRAAQPKRSTPIHGFTVVGIDIPEDKWDESEMNLLGAGNCLVLEKHGGIITIRDAITTDPTSADTQELSVVAGKRLVKRSIRDGLRLAFLNKGIVITDEVLGDLEAGTQTIFIQLINQGEIVAYGKVSNPVTGEVPIRALRDPNEPRRVAITCSVSFAYPLKWIDVTVYPFV